MLKTLMQSKNGRHSADTICNVFLKWSIILKKPKTKKQTEFLKDLYDAMYICFTNVLVASGNKLPAKMLFNVNDAPRCH